MSKTAQVIDRMALKWEKFTERLAHASILSLEADLQTIARTNDAQAKEIKELKDAPPLVLTRLDCPAVITGGDVIAHVTRVPSTGYAHDLAIGPDRRLYKRVGRNDWVPQKDMRVEPPTPVYVEKLYAEDPIPLETGIEHLCKVLWPK